MSEHIDIRTSDNAIIPSKQEALYSALAKANLLFEPVKKNRTATIQTQDGAKTFHYADLSAVMESIRSALCENGLSLIQPIRTQGEKTIIETILQHEEGGIVSSEFTVPFKADNMMQLGQQITYIRRYAISSLLCIAPDDDLDGQAIEGTQSSFAPNSEGQQPTQSDVDDFFEKTQQSWLDAIADGLQTKEDWVHALESRGFMSEKIAQKIQNLTEQMGIN